MIRQRRKIHQKRAQWGKHNRAVRQSTHRRKRKWGNSTQNMPQTTDDTDDYMEGTKATKTGQMETTTKQYD